MRKRMPLIHIIISFILFSLLLSACSDRDESNLDQSNNTLEKEKTVKLDWYIHSAWYNKKWDAEITLFDKTVTEKTGVDINIIIPTSESDENLIAMASTGNLSDIITISNWNGVREQMIKSGYFQPLNKLADQYAPELPAIIPESMKRWNTQEDGNWYGITNHYTAPESLPEGRHVDNGNGIVARKDIMDRLGIKAEDFNTQEGTIQALKKVKSADLVVNGKKVMPFYFEWSDWNMARMWGIPWETPDGNWIDYITHPKYMEIYQFLNRLWREGLIVKDNLTAWQGDKVEDGSCFAYSGNLDAISNAMTILYNLDNAAVYVPVGPIRPLDGSEARYDQAGTGWMTTYITKKCQYPEKAIKLLSFLSSDEGQLLTWFGLEGQTYTWVNGKVRYMDEYLRMKAEDPEMALKVYGINGFWPLQQTTFYNEHIDREALPQADKNYRAILDYFSKFSVNTPETMGVGPEIGTAEAGIDNIIKEYWGNQTRRMVLADSKQEVEKIFHEAVKHIQKLGYDRVYTAANEKYKAQKIKMGKR